ncbi:hypothetical protein QFC22_002552 [Naganishia vaughanmartiniae]|uniref:Uncharacterized protein n=1 Tax=Naganishia vaughanmartiniae TaxID=1424756 RepID=A0ACC2X9B4_9TREE|nr:hypothetical protein QFC22_002552 [Naganishia vaughanmartiniae]
MDGEKVIANPFYLSIPGGENGGFWWVTWIFGVLATLIASQAMITATFSLIQQLMSQKCFPAVRINYTSTITAGQIYIPAVNWILMSGTIITVGIFGSSFAMTLAYGFAVAVVMFITTTMLALHIPFIKNIHWALGMAFLLIFGFFDGLFVGAAVKKVPHGAWFPLVIGTVLCIFMVFWTRCRELEDTFDQDNKKKLTQVVFNQKSEHKLATEHILSNKKIKFEPEGNTERSSSPVFVAELSKSSGANRQRGDSALHQDEVGALYVRRPESGQLLKVERIPSLAIVHKLSEGKGIFLSVRITAVPHVPLRERYLLSKVRSMDGFYGVVMRKGYLDMLAPEVDEILDRICEIEIQYSAVNLEERLKMIKQASLTTTHIIPNYNIKSRKIPGFIPNGIRRVLVEELYGRLRVVFPDESHLSRQTEGYVNLIVKTPSLHAKKGLSGLVENSALKVGVTATI